MVWDVLIMLSIFTAPVVIYTHIYWNRAILTRDVNEAMEMSGDVIHINEFMKLKRDQDMCAKEPKITFSFIINEEVVEDLVYEPSSFILVGRKMVFKGPWNKDARKACKKVIAEFKSHRRKMVTSARFEG